MTTRAPDIVPALTAPGSPLAPLGVHIGTRVPQQRPDQFIRLIAGGGNTAGLGLARATVLVECWGATDGQAYVLAGAAWEILAGLEGAQLAPGLWVQDPAVTLPADAPDTQTGTPRWQFFFTPLVTLEDS